MMKYLKQIMEVVSMKKQETNIEIMELKHELAVYKKALDLACEELAKRIPSVSALSYDYNKYISKKKFLQKAREE